MDNHYSNPFDFYDAVIDHLDPYGYYLELEYSVKPCGTILSPPIFELPMQFVQNNQEDLQECISKSRLAWHYKMTHWENLQIGRMLTKYNQLKCDMVQKKRLYRQILEPYKRYNQLEHGNSPSEMDQKRMFSRQMFEQYNQLHRQRLQLYKDMCAHSSKMKYHERESKWYHMNLGKLPYIVSRSSG